MSQALIMVENMLDEAGIEYSGEQSLKVKNELLELLRHGSFDAYRSFDAAAGINQAAEISSEIRYCEQKWERATKEDQ